MTSYHDVMFYMFLSHDNDRAICIMTRCIYSVYVFFPGCHVYTTETTSLDGRQQMPTSLHRNRCCYDLSDEAGLFLFHLALLTSCIRCDFVHNSPSSRSKCMWRFNYTNRCAITLFFFKFNCAVSLSHSECLVKLKFRQFDNFSINCLQRCNKYTTVCDKRVSSYFLWLFLQFDDLSHTILTTVCNRLWCSWYYIITPSYVQLFVIFFIIWNIYSFFHFIAIVFRC